MKKRTSTISYSSTDTSIKNEVSEPMASLAYVPTVPTYFVPKGYTYLDFLNLAKSVPFTPKEWALMLHLSERTLQRYAQNNTAFEGIYTDRLLHIEQLIKMGLVTFASAQAFYDWIKRDKTVFGQTLNFNALLSTQGIQLLIEEIGRIQYGIYI